LNGSKRLTIPNDQRNKVITCAAFIILNEKCY